MRVLLAGGGTTGHVAPLLATADALARRDPRGSLLVLGTAEGLESRLVPQRGYRLALVPRVPLPRRVGFELARVPARLVAAVRAAEAAIDEVGADVVVGFGGYVAAPAYLAARRRRVPIVVHEQNALPGLANRLGARLAAVVAVTFPATALRGARHVGMPLRREIATLDRAAEQVPARLRLGLEPGRRTLFVTGGSLGAQHINEVLGACAAAFAAAGVQVLHMSGQGKTVPGASSAPARPGEPAYRVLDYVGEIADAYAAADLMVCRAGASTVSEATAVGLPAVYVPLPVGNGEQQRNAEPVAAAGGGLMVPDAALTPDWVLDNVLGLLADSDRLARMGAAAARLGVRDADDRLAELIEQAARGGVGGRS